MNGADYIFKTEGLKEVMVVAVTYEIFTEGTRI